MSKDFAFMFYPGEYLRDTQCLSEKTQVAYDRIMCEHMRNICITQQQLNFFTKRLSPDEMSELLFILNKINGGYEIEWVAKSIRDRIAYTNSRRNNRNGKGKKNKDNISGTYDEDKVDKDKDVNISFDDFWNLYDKKRGDKNKLEIKWEKLTDTERQLAMDYIPKYKESTPDKSFRKDPQTFLNNKSWNDEIILRSESKQFICPEHAPSY